MSASHRFGPFVTDRVGYRLLRGDQALDLTPKLLDLLFHLLDHSGALVTKEQLLDAVWPDANVTENALAQAVSDLRQALGDDAGEPRFIKTIARRGYRFIGAVETLDDIGQQPTSTYAGERSTRDDRSIAVLDFTNVTGDTDGAWLSAGIAETVTSDLRRRGDLRVVDRWHVMEAARRTGGSLQRMADDLRARLLVFGSYQRSSDRIRITARVVDVVTGEAVADAKVDGPLDRIFELQDEVAAQFSKEIGVSMGERLQGRTRETPSLQAFRAFTEGWLRLETLDTREIPTAIADFEHAVSADPHYPLAYTGLASAEFALYETTRSDNAPRQDLLDEAVEHARHAVHLDATLAEGYATLGLILVSAWQTAEALAAARRAIALEPTNWRHLFRLGHASWGEPRLRAAARTLALYPDFAFAYFQTAMVHVARGDLTAAETVLRQGAAVQDRQIGRGERYPALGLHWLLGLVRLVENDVDEALGEFEREAQLAEPHRLYGREYAMNAAHGRGLCLLHSRRPDEAIAAFQRALDLYPYHAPSNIGLALALRAAGSPQMADAVFEKVREALAILRKSRPVEAAIVRAEMLTALGQGDEALATLERLLTDAPPGFAAWTIPAEPLLRQLAATKRFAAILGRLAERAR